MLKISAIGHFAQADTLVPDPYNSHDYQRYGYTRYNFLKYNDPSGNRPTEGCGTDEKQQCSGSDNEKTAYEYWRQRNDINKCNAGASVYCSPVDNLLKLPSKIDEKLGSQIELQLAKPQYESLLANQFTPIGFAAASVIATDAQYAATIFIPPAHPAYPVAIGSSYIVARVTGIVSSVSTGYQYKNNLYGTTENDVRISEYATLISALPKPDMGWVNHASFFYSFLRTFGGMESP